MRNPFKRRPDPASRPDTVRPDDTAEAVRGRLTEQAVHAPSGEFLAERIIARAEAAHGAGAHRPRVAPARAPWGRIVAVAAAVAVVAGAGVAVAQYDPSPDRPVAERTTTPAPRTSPTPTRTPTTATPSTDRSDEPTTNTSDSRIVRVPTLTGVRVVDVTFTGTEDGWGLASADCLRSSGRCTALLRTTDGSKVWQSRPNTPFHVPGVDDCSAPCVSHIRFATDDIGYAFGPTALFITTDGAESWRPVEGGADALETLDGNVIRVSTVDGRRRVQTSDIGSLDWTTVRLPGDQGPKDGAVTLARSGSHAYVLSVGDTGSVLWTSSKDGTGWTNRAEVCAQRGGPVDARALTTAADGSVVVACRERTGGKQFVAVSTDDAVSFRAGPSVLGAADVGALGAASATTVLVSSDDTYRSTDGGRTFDRLAADAGSSPGRAGYLGFSSDTEAHAISSDGHVIFTTTDAGRTWAAVRFR